MNIQQFIDRKRIAGAREHEGNGSDWAGWTREQFLAAIAGELLDTLAYVEQSLTTAKWPGCCIEENMVSANVQTALGILPIEALEAACQEAEQEANETLPEKVRHMQREAEPFDGKKFLESCAILGGMLTEEERNAPIEDDEEELPKERMCELVITKSNDPVYPTTAIIKNWKDGRLSETIIPLLGWSISFDLRAKDGHSPFIAKGATIELSGVDDEVKQEAENG